MKFLRELQQGSLGFIWDKVNRWVFEPVGGLFFNTTKVVGDFFLFAGQAFGWFVRHPLRFNLIFKQMEFIGVNSLSIIALTGLFSGMVFALQTGNAFALFNAETFVGSTVGLALAREIAPVFTALMVVARAGSAMAAEIGSMKVTEQLDALQSMAVEPIEYLVVPRMIAGIVMVPILSGLFLLIGVAGAYVVAIKLLMIGESAFVHNLEYYLDISDVVGGMLKAGVFGLMLTTLSCWCGYRTEGGAEGVGRATTKAVVISSVVILVADYFLTAWILEYFPEF